MKASKQHWRVHSVVWPVVGWVGLHLEGLEALACWSDGVVLLVRLVWVIGNAFAFKKSAMDSMGCADCVSTQLLQFFFWVHAVFGPLRTSDIVIESTSLGTCSIRKSSSNLYTVPAFVAKWCVFPLTPRTSSTAQSSLAALASGKALKLIDWWSPVISRNILLSEVSLENEMHLEHMGEYNEAGWVGSY